MKKLCCEKDIAICNDLKARLESVGISCVVKSEEKDSLFKQKRGKKPAHELWVVVDENFDDAWTILNEQRKPSPETDDV
jgi:hypothetical protein